MKPSTTKRYVQQLDLDYPESPYTRIAAIQPPSNKQHNGMKNSNNTVNYSININRRAVVIWMMQHGRPKHGHDIIHERFEIHARFLRRHPIRLFMPNVAHLQLPGNAIHSRDVGYE